MFDLGCHRYRSSDLYKIPDIIVNVRLQCYKIGQIIEKVEKMPEKGFLLLSDITGYSVYLNESELEHAQSSLTDLLKVLIEHTRLPLTISKLEGDAVFSFAAEGSFLQGQTLVETIEITYAAFRKALDLMVLNTTCRCNACRNLPNLDLKFFVHFGEYSIQDLGDFRELVGHDVNLIHRLMKNSITEKTGLKAYAAYTQAVVDALEMQVLLEDMIPHTESYKDVGEVSIFVQEITTTWEQRKEQMRMVVDEINSVSQRQIDFPLPPSIVWEYITKPEFRNILHNSDTQYVNGQSSGRIGTDAVYICAHGNNEFNQKILDWSPFEEYTTEDQTPLHEVCSRVTYRITPMEQGSRLTILWGPHTGPRLIAKIMDLISPFFIRYIWSKGEDQLVKKIAQDVESGETKLYPKIEFGNEMAARAITESLKEQGS
jgi:hypothetical protein